MKKIILTTIAALITFNTYAVKAATSTDCATLGYTNTASQCSGKAILKCPFDNNKIYCGTTACDLVTEAANCSLGCQEYHSTCPSKCKTCKVADPCIARYNNLNYNYQYVIKKATGCGNYVSWDGGFFEISVYDTCSTWKANRKAEVDKYNLECGDSYKKITSSPSLVNCNTCCVKTGVEVPYLSHCDDVF